MRWKDYLAGAEQKLIEAGVEDARTNVEYLAANLLGFASRAQLPGKLHTEISDAEVKVFNELLFRRLNREPLQYILGEWEFYGIPIALNSSVLIPRPETEILVEQALVEANSMVGDTSVLDIGTGSGCIAIALAQYLPNASVLGIDVSEEAMRLARNNAVRVLNENSNITFRVADIFSEEWERPQSQKYDLIVSNPPYISRRDFETLEPELRNFEPRAALTDESDGLAFYRRIAKLASTLLTRRGRLMVEIGYGASDAVEKIIDSSGLVVIKIANDLSGIPRVLVASIGL